MSQPNGSPMTVGQLLGVLGGVRRHALLVWWATTVLGTVGVAAALLVAALFIDHYFVLPTLLRAALLLAVIAGPVVFVRHAWRQHPGGSPEELALLVEQRYPALDNALINSVQLAQHHPDGSERIVAAITEDAQQAVKSVRPSRAVNKRELSIVGAVASLAGLLLLGHAMTDAQALSTGLNRMLLPFADNTLTKIVEVTPGSDDVLAGTGAELAVRVSGRVPTQAQLVGTYPDGRQVRLAMTPPSESNPELLTARIDRLEQNLRYHVVAGDDQSASYELRVHEAPTVARLFQRILPPDYLSAEPTQQSGGNIRAPVGSKVELRVEAAEAFESGTITLVGAQNDGAQDGAQNDSAQANDQLVRMDKASPVAGVATLPVDAPREYRIALTHRLGFTSEPATYRIVPEPDRSPQASFRAPAHDQAVAIDAKLRVQLQASDDHGVKQIELRQLDPSQLNQPAAERDEGKQVRVRTFEEHDKKQADAEHVIDVAALGLSADAPIVLQAVARDFNPDGAPGRSAPLTLRLEEPQSEDDATGQPDYDHVSLARLIRLQRTNIASSETYRGTLNHEAAANGADDNDDIEPLPAIIERQAQLRTEALKLAATAEDGGANNPFIASRLKGLADSLMVVAVDQLDRVPRSGDPHRLMGEAIATQRSILKELIVADAKQDSQLEDERHRAIAEALAELIAKQEAVRADTSNQAATTEALGARQRVLARDAAMVQRQMQREADSGAGGNPELAEQYAAAAAAFDEHRIRANMIIIVERLRNASDSAMAPALSLQDQVLADLKAIEKLLQDAAAAEAEQKLAETEKDLRDAKKKLDRMVEIQEAVTEVAKQMEKTQDLRDEKTGPRSELLQELDEARRNQADAVEQLAKDLHIHPDLSVSNDLLTELKEVFEDIKQQPGSEDTPVNEIAVTRDEAALARLKAMQEEMGERIEDDEIILPNSPNNMKWQRETFDRDELGEIPLGELPEGLEDLVGEMLEYNEELRKQAEDTPSNVHTPDQKFGDEVRDGDLPSWAAKGKSGNEPPEEKNQTGRSGSGRQGMSSGEIVEDKIKALEGSDVQTRRTNDGFQSGQLEEEDPNAMDVKATGGGKMAGASPGEGMQGDAPPRNELHYRKLAREHQQLQRQIESVYSKARLMRLPTGELDQALLQMHAARRQLESGDIVDFMRRQEKVVRSFERTQAGLRGRQIVQGQSTASESDAAIVGATDEPVPEQYEEAVADYMRRITERE